MIPNTPHQISYPLTLRLLCDVVVAVEPHLQPHVDHMLLQLDHLSEVAEDQRESVVNAMLAHAMQHFDLMETRYFTNDRRHIPAFWDHVPTMYRLGSSFSDDKISRRQWVCQFDQADPAFLRSMIPVLLLRCMGVITNWSVALSDENNSEFCRRYNKVISGSAHMVFNG